LWGQGGAYIVEVLVPEINAEHDWIFTLERQLDVSKSADYNVTLLELNQAKEEAPTEKSPLSTGAILVIVFVVTFGIALMTFVLTYTLTRKKSGHHHQHQVHNEPSFAQLKESLYTPPTVDLDHDQLAN